MIMPSIAPTNMAIRICVVRLEKMDGFLDTVDVMFYNFTKRFVMKWNALALMVAASFCVKKKPLDCARGDKHKRYSGQQEIASNHSNDTFY